MKRVLVTGGAGFIGTHLSRRLVNEGYYVSILDNFLPQVHGASRDLAEDLRDKVDLTIGDVRNKEVFHAALMEKDIVVHLAAETGTGQSMYETVRYEEVNIGGTALLLDFVTNNRKSSISKIVIASSRAIYGEGKYRCGEHGEVYPDGRKIQDLKCGDFEPKCPICSASCEALPTDENSKIHPASFYGITKCTQEQMVLLYGKSLGIPVYALRYQNVYGPGQSFHNPYTGILATFSSLARHRKIINVFEGGLESRDFIYIEDVVEATMRSIARVGQVSAAFNVGSGVATSILNVARAMSEYFGGNLDINITGDFRVGDIRHNFADLRKVKSELGFHPKWQFVEGVGEFLRSSENVTEITRSHIASLKELKKVGLFFQRGT
jgi:dTDP-L-rhamnose 4-epimerase